MRPHRVGRGAGPIVRPRKRCPYVGNFSWSSDVRELGAPRAVLDQCDRGPVLLIPGPAPSGPASHADVAGGDE